MLKQQYFVAGGAYKCEFVAVVHTQATHDASVILAEFQLGGV